MTLLAISGDTYWTIALVIGLVAALVVAGLLAMLLVNVGRIQRSVEGLLETAGKVGANTANIPQLEATAPVLAQIVDEAVVQDGYMNALTDGFGEGRRHEHRHVHPAQRPARGRRDRGARGRADQGPPGPERDLGGSRDARDRAERRRGRAPASARAGREGDQRPVRRHPSALPGIARKAAIVAERRPR